MEIFNFRSAKLALMAIAVEEVLTNFISGPPKLTMASSPGVT